MFDSHEQKIVSLSKMSEGRDLRNKLVVFDGNLYACGGNTCSMEKYNLHQQMWSSLR